MDTVSLPDGIADAETAAMLAAPEAALPAAPPPAVTNVTPSVGDPVVTIRRGQRGPQKTARIEFAGDYAGLWVVAWINPKRKLFRDLNSGDEERSDGALALMILDHNLSWSDESATPGEVMPKPLTYDALGDLEQDLYIEIGRGIGEAVNKLVELPKSR